MVSSGRARLRFATLPKKDFPILHQQSVKARFTLDPKVLTRALGVVRHAGQTFLNAHPQNLDVVVRAQAGSTALSVAEVETLLNSAYVKAAQA